MILTPSQYPDECSISLEKFEDLAKKKELVAISCGHKFQRLAISDWLKKDASCPTCRRKVEKEKLVDVAIFVEKMVLDKKEYFHECPIFFRTFKELAEEKELVALSCGDKFERKPIAKWLEDHSSCPLCCKTVPKNLFTEVVLPKPELSVYDYNGDRKQDEALEAALAASERETNEPLTEETLARAKARFKTIVDDSADLDAVLTQPPVEQKKSQSLCTKITSFFNSLFT